MWKSIANQLFRPAWILIIIPFITLSSCRDLVQDEFPDITPVPTINSFLIPDSIFKVHVSLSDELDSVPLGLIDNAEVQLFKDGAFEEILTPEGKGWYSASQLVKYGSRYQCKVKIEGFEELSCSDSLPVPSDILNIEHIINAGKNEEGLSYPAVKVTFSNKPNEKRYYELIIRIDYHGWWHKADMFDITDPVLLSEGLPLSVFSNENIDGDNYTMLLNYSTGSSSSRDGGIHKMDLFPFAVELRSISYNYYLYLRQLYLYEIGRYPDFTDGYTGTFPLHSNITNGYGIFAGYSTTISDIINPE